MATVLGIMLVSLAIAFYFAAIKAPSNPAAKDLAHTCTEIWKTSAAAIVGLLVGKAT